MENIIIPNNNFDFSRISLAHPIGIQGGAYFTKIEYNNKPLYIQTTKSLTRQAFVKTGKKYYCDLMFDNNSSELINWFEKLEEQCQKLIFSKSDAWFEGTLEESDVESAFNPVVRLYKSGKFYLVRANIKNNSMTNEPVIKIYNEREIPLAINDITSENNMISILEILGIKFTSRNFQIEIEMKQAMVLDDEPIFDNCLIKSSRMNDIKENLGNNSHVNHEKILNENVRKNTGENSVIDISTNELSESIDKYLENLSIKDKNEKSSVIEKEKLTDNFSEPNKNNEMNTLKNNFTENNINGGNNIVGEYNNKNNDIAELDFADLNFDENNSNIEEIDLDISLENNLETIKLKKPNQVYYELYKEARNKAKEAKKAAIIAFLEAKKIKKTYMIENMEDSDEIDEEIEEMSDSELEGL
jgi:hypothetical protein